MAYVRKYLKRADHFKWVHILDWSGEYPGDESEGSTFSYVFCELLPKRTVPDYPKRSLYRNQKGYLDACRYMIWKAASGDIRAYQEKGFYGPRYRIYGKWKQGSNRDPFLPGTPDCYRKLMENPLDRTDPLWDSIEKWYASQRSKFRITRVVRENTEPHRKGCESYV